MGELLARVTSTELAEWAAYERVAGPLGPAREDLQAGIIAATTANAMSDGKGRRAEPADFIPEWDRHRDQTWQEQLAVVRQLNAMFGGTETAEG